MSDLNAQYFIDDYLAHYGVKGMRWGVTRDRHGRNRWTPDGHSLEEDIAKAVILPIGFSVPAQFRLAVRASAALRERAAQKSAEKLAAKAEQKSNAAEKKWAKKASSFNTLMSVNNAFAERVNNTSKFEDFYKAHPEVAGSAGEKNPLAHDKAFNDYFRKDFQDAIDSVIPPSPNGTRVKALDVMELSYSFEEPSAKHDATDFLDDYLAHYGVKGMRWGVRKEPSAVSTTTAVSRSGKVKVKASGGHAQPVSSDAVKAHETKQKLKASGPNSLSNKELQELAQRLELEQRTMRLANTQSPGQKFVNDLIGNSGKRAVSRVANQAVDDALRKKDLIQ